ncbi:hypothetical protein CHUAL_010535 [Chamberlinius hualienensis]
MCEMEGFMPSEIARLILGYLKETSCKKTVGMFLNESSHLTEYVELLLNGKEYPTSINGKSLLDILNEYCQLKCQGINKTSNSTPLCTRSLLLSTRRQQNSEVGTSCDDNLLGQKLLLNETTHMIEVGTQMEPTLIESDLTTPVKNILSTPITLTTPCRSADLYSSPCSLIKTALFNLQVGTPSRCNISENTTLECRSNSPRRKGPLPRKRLYSPSPNSIRSTPLSKRFAVDYGEVVSASSTPEDFSGVGYSTDFNYDELIKGLLQNPQLPERIAASINEEKSHPTIQIPDTIDASIKNMVDRTESDPVIGEFLNEYVIDKQDGGSFDSQNSLLSSMSNFIKPNNNSNVVSSSEKPTETKADDSKQNLDLADNNWSSNSTSNSTNTSLAYLIPVEGNMYELVTAIAEESKSDANKPSTSPLLPLPIQPSKERQFHTLSPGHLFSVTSKKDPKGPKSTVNKKEISSATTQMIAGSF